MKFSIGIGQLVQEIQQFSKNLVKVAILVMVLELLKCRE